MAKYVPMDLLKSLKGKVCGHSDTYFAERNGTLYTGKMCYPSTKPATANQIAQREKFGKVNTAVAVRMADTTKQTADQAAFAAQKKYSSMRSYLYSIAYAAYDSTTKAVVWPTA